MARTSGPLFSLDASGSVAKTVTYSKWKGRNYVRRWAIPANPRSDPQYYTRAMFAFLSMTWADLGAANQALWNALAGSDNVTPMNAFVRFNMQRWTQGTAPKVDPAGTGGAAATIGTLTPTAGVGQVSLSQAFTTSGGDEWGCIFLARLGSSPAGAKAFTRYVAKGASLVMGTPATAVIRNLEPGTWHFQGAVFDDKGNLSTFSTAASAVVT